MICKKNWESLVTLELPSDCWVVVWKIESEKQNNLTFFTKPPETERDSIKKMSHDKDQKEKESPYLNMSRDNDQKSCIKG